MYADTSKSSKSLIAGALFKHVHLDLGDTFEFSYFLMSVDVFIKWPEDHVILNVITRSAIPK